jgi:hypothetical protein
MKSLDKQLIDLKGKVVWMASYPKSGNTWFRCFLSALFTNKVELNRINTDGIFSSRNLFDSVTDVDSRLFNEEESKLTIASVYNFHLSHAPKLEFTKVHDAYSLDREGKPIFPTQNTHHVVYLVRNPLDVVASYANHNSTTNDKSISMMNDKDGYLVAQRHGHNNMNQLPQMMHDWSGHVKSWLDQKEIPVTVMRYEDTKKDPVNSFHRVMTEIGLKVSKKKVKAAVELAKFERLREMEDDQGFKEKAPTVTNFFRSGKSGGYRDELTLNQIESIISQHKDVMRELGYEMPVIQVD